MYPTDVILFQVARMLMTKLVARQMGTMRVMNQSEVGKHSISLSIFFQYFSVIFSNFQYFLSIFKAEGAMRVMNQSVVVKHSIFFSIFQGRSGPKCLSIEPSDFEYDVFRSNKILVKIIPKRICNLL